MVQVLDYFSVSSRFIVEEAEKMGYEVEMIQRDKNLFFIRGNWKEILFKSTDFWENSALGLKLANDKELSYHILDRGNFPTAKSVYLDVSQFLDFSEKDIAKLQFPLIIKPTDEGHGNGVITGIENFQELKNFLQTSFENYKKMIIQEQIMWEEIRIIVVKNTVVAVIQRVPAFVVWDGKSTIEQLIQKENTDNPKRGKWNAKKLSFIEITDELKTYIQKHNWQLDSIPKENETVQLLGISNVSAGGIPIDITDTTCEEIKQQSIQIAKLFGLSIAGIDVLCSDYTKPLSETGGVILEVNATPGTSLMWRTKTRTMLDLIFKT